MVRSVDPIGGWSFNSAKNSKEAPITPPPAIKINQAPSSPSDKEIRGGSVYQSIMSAFSAGTPRNESFKGKVLGCEAKVQAEKGLISPRNQRIQSVFGSFFLIGSTIGGFFFKPFGILLGGAISPPFSLITLTFMNVLYGPGDPEIACRSIEESEPDYKMKITIEGEEYTIKGTETELQEIKQKVDKLKSWFWSVFEDGVQYSRSDFIKGILEQLKKMEGFSSSGNAGRAILKKVSLEEKPPLEPVIGKDGSKYTPESIRLALKDGEDSKKADLLASLKEDGEAVEDIRRMLRDNPKSFINKVMLKKFDKLCEENGLRKVANFPSEVTEKAKQVEKVDVALKGMGLKRKTSKKPYTGPMEEGKVRSDLWITSKEKEKAEEELLGNPKASEKMDESKKEAEILQLKPILLCSKSEVPTESPIWLNSVDDSVKPTPKEKREQRLEMIFKEFLPFITPIREKGKTPYIDNAGRDRTRLDQFTPIYANIVRNDRKGNLLDLIIQDKDRKALTFMLSVGKIPVRDVQEVLDRHSKGLIDSFRIDLKEYCREMRALESK